MPANVPCLIQLTVVANFIKIEKFTNGILIKTRWVPSSNMFLPCMDTECIGNSYYTKIQTIGDDGKPHTITTLPLNCVYRFGTNGDYQDPQIFETIQDLCAALNSLRCAPCEIVGQSEDCNINISSITDGGDGQGTWVLGMDGTTPDGYIVLTFPDGQGVLPNSNGDMQPINYNTYLNDNGIILCTYSRSLSETGDPICGAPYVLSILHDSLEVPEVGAPTIYQVSDIVGLPACGGVVSYQLVSDRTGLCSLDTITGEVTISAGVPDYITDSFAVIAQICTTDGLPSVLSVVCLLIANPSFGLRLTYTPGNKPANDLAAWNAFFDLPANGTAFTSLSETGDEVTLYGGANISLKAGLFRNSATLLKIEDDADCVVAILGGKNAGALSFCSALTTITLNGVISAQSEACFSNAELLNVTLNSVTTIGSFFMGGYPEVVTLTLPSLITAGESAFSNCTALTTFTAVALETALDSAFNGCTALITVTAPSLISAGDTAFIGCTDLVSISLPALETAGAGMFGGCIRLETVKLASVTDLGGTTGDDTVFLGCTLLTSVTVPTALATIDSGNPDGDLVYADVTLGATITYI